MQELAAEKKEVAVEKAAAAGSAEQVGFVEGEVDIFKHPAKIRKLFPEEDQTRGQITVGDLHGNPMKILHLLVLHGVIEISPENYKRLAHIYQNYISSDKYGGETALLLNKHKAKYSKYIRDFERIISNLSVKNKPLIRFLGDTICDRGRNDYFFYLILDKLNQEKVPVEILKSDHDIEAIVPFEEYAQTGRIKDLQSPLFGDNQHATSLVGLRHSIAVG